METFFYERNHVPYTSTNYDTIKFGSQHKIVDTIRVFNKKMFFLLIKHRFQNGYQHLPMYTYIYICTCKHHSLHNQLLSTFLYFIKRTYETRLVLSFTLNN